MTADKNTRQGGYFRWNRGGWFGGQLGGTAWLLAAAAAIGFRAPGVAAVFGACFAVANAVGIFLWLRRDSLRPYAAIQLLVLVCGVSSFIAWLTLTWVRPDVVAALGWHSYLVFLVVPAIMVWFALLERRARLDGAAS
jgi:hypothetical protein